MVLDLLVPARCAGCGARGVPCCAECSRVWGSLTEVVRAPLAGLAPAYALARYQGVAKRVLIAYKERGRRDVAPALGRVLASALAALPRAGAPRAGPSREGHSLGGPSFGEPAFAGSSRPGSRLGKPVAAGDSARGGPWCLVPAPSRRSASRLRGGPHVQRLADAAACCLAQTGAEAFVAPALALKGARDAVGLSRAERVANLAGRLRFVPAGRPPPGSRVVVLDDVVTTGATAAACVRALTDAGVAVSAVVALLAAG
ncbi:ComF family protein [Amycolatopsis carbonis]|uniref:ComF family protein n=1 Tax=Amycolatopsis carbonis TaxID=715471 RepID=A0A9Y2MUQ0_9PSEU|nr:ComF family protein [Amycolatopsis sp. 2-15]WIX82060.1 ComF family protein [Amycolatopsis sp. 2-15]